MVPYVYALASNVSFAGASLVYEHYSRIKSPVLVNFYKAIVAFVGFTLFSWAWAPSFVFESEIVWTLIASGIIGLALGDLFLLNGFIRLGTARALMLFGFHPILLGVAEWVMFGQEIRMAQMLAVAFLISSLLVFSFESYKNRGHWEVAGLSFALMAVILDATGILMTKWAYEADPTLTTYTANFYRCLGASAALLIFMLWKSSRPKMTLRQYGLLTVFSILGTLLALTWYLEAVRTGELSIVSAIAITGPLFAASVECILEKKRPSLYLLGGFVLFSVALLILAFF